MQAEPGSKIQLGRVLALKHGGKFVVGQPYMSDVRVEAEVLEELKGPKVRGVVGCASWGFEGGRGPEGGGVARGCVGICLVGWGGCAV